jgi:hypothetical protein
LSVNIASMKSVFEIFTLDEIVFTKWPELRSFYLCPENIVLYVDEFVIVNWLVVCVVINTAAES